MSTAENFFNRINSVQDLEQLIGQPEDAVFDCKTWSDRLEANRGSIAKAACGFTNSVGGVILVGLGASGRGADSPDVVNSLKPVIAVSEVASQALDIVLKFVEPGIVGVNSKTILLPNDVDGFLIILIPESEDAVRRSRVDWRFYVRIASGTVPMEYFQIEERFGRRPRPNLQVSISVSAISVHGIALISVPARHIDVWLENIGRGMARFPGLRIKQSGSFSIAQFGIDGNGGNGLPPAASEREFLLFRGGSDHVIYPGERYLAGRLVETVSKNEESIPQPVSRGVSLIRRTWKLFHEDFLGEVYAEGTVAGKFRLSLPADSAVEDIQTRS